MQVIGTNVAGALSLSMLSRLSMCLFFPQQPVSPTVPGACVAASGDMVTSATLCGGTAASETRRRRPQQQMMSRSLRLLLVSSSNSIVAPC